MKKGKLGGRRKGGNIKCIRNCNRIPRRISCKTSRFPSIHSGFFARALEFAKWFFGVLPKWRKVSGSIRNLENGVSIFRYCEIQRRKQVNIEICLWHFCPFPCFLVGSLYLLGRNSDRWTVCSLKCQFYRLSNPASKNIPFLNTFPTCPIGSSTFVLPVFFSQVNPADKPLKNPLTCLITLIDPCFFKGKTKVFGRKFFLEKKGQWRVFVTKLRLKKTG